MIYDVLVSDEAIFDIAEASFWYGKKKKELAKKFQEEIKQSIEYLSKEPQTIQKKYKNVHIYFTKTFPFGIHYIMDKKTIKLIAVFHISINPKNWTDKI